MAYATLARLQGLAAGIADGVSGVWNGYFALRGVERDSRRVLIGQDAVAFDLMQRILPTWYQHIVMSGVRRTID